MEENSVRRVEKSEGPGCFQQYIDGAWQDVPVVTLEDDAVKEEVEQEDESTLSSETSEGDSDTDNEDPKQ